MKYKVVLDNNLPSSGGFGVGLTFYRKSEAISCCEAWVETANREAMMWDGTSWTRYAS